MTTPFRRAAWLIAAGSALAVTALFAAACGDDDDTSEPTPTATTASATKPPEVATATVPATSTPVPRTATPAASPTLALREAGGEAGFRAFAKLLDTTIQADARTLLDRLKGTPYTCKAEDIPRQLGGPACDSVGQTFDAIQSGNWRSSGGLVPVAVVRDGLSRSFFGALEQTATDAFGDGRPRVYAISVSGTTYKTAVTGLVTRPANFSGSGPLRVTYIHTWTFENGRWVTYQQLTALVLAEEFLKPGTADTQGAFPNWEKLN